MVIGTPEYDQLKSLYPSLLIELLESGKERLSLTLPLGLVRLISMRKRLEGIYSTPIVVWNYSPSIPSYPLQSSPNRTRP
uniref:Uncharacterized protein n=1 Tax=Oryza barthii TaxID=65489 RepID=A0A0D3GXM6_9ORYZ